jgi:hypothetical protein
LVIVKVGADGKVNVYNKLGQTHVIFDVVGWYGATGGDFNPLTPARILDTRNGTGGISGKVGPGGVITVPGAGVGGVPASGAAALIVNVTVNEPTAGSFLTVYPSDSELPLASNLNFNAGQTVPNLVVVKLGADGMTKAFNRCGDTHVIFDVVGWFGTGGSAGPAAPPNPPTPC